MKRAVGYTRVSTMSQVDEDKISMEDQEQIVQAYCISHGLEYVRTYLEPARSGATIEERPELQRLLNDARRGLFDIVAVKEITRFGRNLVDIKQNVEKLSRCGVTFVAVEDNVDTSKDTKTGDLVLSILGAVAEFDRSTILERTHSIRSTLWVNKDIFVGQPPFGYFWNEDLKRLEEHPVEGPIYRRIVEEYLKPGKSLSKLVFQLRADHVPTRRSGPRWSSAALAKILRNPAHHSGKVVTNEDTPRKQKEREKNTNRSKKVPPRPKGKIIYDCPRLVTKKDWDSVILKLSNGKIRSGRPAKAEEVFLLYGKLRCGLCGATLSTYYSSRTRKDGTWLRSYGCTYHERPERYLFGHPPCDLPRIKAEKIEDYVLNDLRNLLIGARHQYAELDPERWNRKIAKTQEKIENIKKEKKEWEVAQRRLPRLLRAKKKFDENEYIRLQDEITTALDRLDIDLQEAEAELENDRTLKSQESILLEFREKRPQILRKILFEIGELPFQMRRRLVLGLMDEEQQLIISGKDWAQNLEIPWKLNLSLLREIFSDILSPEPDDPNGSGSGGSNGCGCGRQKKPEGNCCYGAHHHRDNPCGGRLGYQGESDGGEIKLSDRQDESRSEKPHDAALFIRSHALCGENHDDIGGACQEAAQGHLHDARRF